MAFETEHIEIDGSLNVDGSIYQWNTLFTGGTPGGSDASLQDVLTNGSYTYNRSITMNGLNDDVKKKIKL